MSFLKFSRPIDNTDLLMLGCGILVGLGLRSKHVFGGFIQKTVGLKSLLGNISVADYSLVLVVRNDLHMGKGKMCSQCAHASVIAYSNALATNPGLVRAWAGSGQKKIVVQTENENSLLELASQAENLGLPANIVQDCGYTQVAPRTKTVLSIGPGLKSQLDKVSSNLKLL